MPPPPTPALNLLHYFAEDGKGLKVEGGAVNILTNRNALISGNYTANLRDYNNVAKYLVGSFKDVPVKP
jgi:hypothetical protein